MGLSYGTYLMQSSRTRLGRAGRRRQGSRAARWLQRQDARRACTVLFSLAAHVSITSLCSFATRLAAATCTAVGRRNRRRRCVYILGATRGNGARIDHPQRRAWLHTGVYIGLLPHRYPPIGGFVRSYRPCVCVCVCGSPPVSLPSTVCDSLGPVLT